MKLNQLIPVMLIAFISFSGFQLMRSESKTNKANDWGEWMNSDCFRGVDYRAKRGDFNSYANKWHWDVQFRNRYGNRLNYSYAVDEPGTLPEPDHRDHIGAGDISDTKAFLLNSSKACRIRVGNVRFGYDDTGSYQECDQ